MTSLQSKLRIFEEDNTDKMFSLAKQLLERGTFEYYFNNQQLLVLTTILQHTEARTLFKEFMESNVSLRFIEPEDKSKSGGNQGEDDDPINEQTIPNGVESARRLALKVRYILFDRAIDMYYDGAGLDDYEIFEDDDDKQPKTDLAKAAPVRKIDEDYDDDYDDDDEEEEKDTKTDEVDGNLNLEKNSYGCTVLEVPICETDTTPLDSKTLIENFNKIYHNFENDKETIIKRKKLEANDKLIEETDDLANLKDSFMSLGAANLSLKHLLRSIDDNKEKLQLQDTELRQLIMDVRKNRSKWASDDKVGQEELYEACEKVVMELRNYTEHSTAFLNKVSKREAPNYLQVIKKPMDLNTILKKLKSFQYKSKQEFVDDVMLIWKNCLTYNSDPSHFLRSHAIAMQKKSLLLIPLIPDITVRDRSEVEAENAALEDSATPMPSGKTTSKKGKKRTRNGEVKLESPKPEALDSSMLDSGTTTPMPGTQGTTTFLDADTTAATPLNNKSLNATFGDATEIEDDDEGDTNDYLDNNGDDDKDDFELNQWKSLTSKTRADLCIKRSCLFTSTGSLNAEASAILRDPKKMMKFDSYLKNYTESKKKLFRASGKGEDDIYLIEYDISGGYPQVHYAGKSELDIDEEEAKLLDKILSQGGVGEKKPPSGLDEIINENIKEMQEIRKICFKISVIRQMQQHQFIHHSQLKPPEIQDIDDSMELDPLSTLPTHDGMNRDLIYSMLKKKVSKVAMMSGFETTERTAIDTLTQVAGKYMNGLVASIKTHLETPSINGEQKRKDAVMLALLQNGITKPEQLHTYVHDNVLRQRTKLKDLRAKMSQFLKSLLKPAFEMTEKTFEDNSDQFLSGDFSNEIGDDFFGFKELGLDKEMGMLSNSIPLHLLHSRFAEANQQDVAKKNKRQEFEKKPFKRLLDTEISTQIKLFQPFLQQELHRTKILNSKQIKSKKEAQEYMTSATNVTILDDEDYPKRVQRSKLPPTGKITAGKRKVQPNTFFLPEVNGF